MPQHLLTPLRFLTMLCTLGLIAACANHATLATNSPPMRCDMQGLGQLQIDAQTRIVAVQAFRAGDEVRLANSPAPHAQTAVDVCMVKLLVGPGHPGPATAPSTSPGIGIEVWLPQPAQWNQTLRAYGSGGWAGGFYADPTRIGQTGSANPLFLAAVQKGYAVSGSDHGHGGTVSGRNASFGMKPDGTLNTVLWHDFAERSLLEQALKTKAVVKAYYGRPQTHAYFDGFSTGGRQGYKLAQRYPEQYDGILAGAPAFNWTRFITAELYPQIVMQQDLGGPLPNAKLHATSALALRACGGIQASWGFLLDPWACTYNPARDAQALCQGEKGEAGTVGTNSASTCLQLKQAQAINKIWYGMTRDGSAPDPAVDNGHSAQPANTRGQMWWGPTRGTDLTALAGEQAPFPISSQVTAFSLNNPRIAQKGMFSNASGDAADGWKQLGYDQLATAYERGLAMQTDLSHINSDSTDLSAFRARGAKILSYHGLSDQLIMPQGSLNYFDRLVKAYGSAATVQSFNRLFFIPGLGHAGSFNQSGSVGSDGQVTPASKAALPQPSTGRDELFNALRQWVEKGLAPERIELSAASGQLSLPICSHPKKSTFTGNNPNLASHYDCR